MHRDKTAARILLILSVVHNAVAAPEIVRPRFMDVDEDVTPASDNRGNPGETSQDLYPGPPIYDDWPSTSGAPQLDNDSPLALGTSQLDNDPPPASRTPQLDNDRPSASGTLQLDNDPPPASGAPNLHDDPLPALGTPQLHDDPLTTPGTSPVHDDLPLGSGEFDESWRFNDILYIPSVHDSEVPSPSNFESVASVAPPSTPPEANGVLSDSMKLKLKALGAYGALVGVSMGLVALIHKIIKDQSQRAYVLLFSLPLLDI